MSEKQISPFDNPNRLIPLPEAAVLLGCSSRSLHRRLMEDPHLQKIRRRYKNRTYFPYEALLAYSKSLEVTPNANPTSAEVVFAEIAKS